ncbi:TIGR02281 family clan AA aspartic protease [Rhizobiales bacterium RZME27]|uniref:TIGR02281 family clan AA aspartic protease n=1 Tax=Endobacterium cereale TaxID=2663029 RepID=A0A6A8A4Z7_9HYPH|nr:TIGR02281 family clan AA aspartic protease [Endobacterium cereale]MEB2844965.1 TIGR02281 family clan AA aspartic protease [Endobacterium cereale]MQY44877.1 TIGR02281 family clan AA aspartic protease [Endobacterium cereale]
MLLRTTIFASVAVVAATQVPRLFEHMQQRQPEISAKQNVVTPQVQKAALPNGRISLKADGRGHFFGTFQMNGKSIEGLVDTGASTIAINETTARRLGFTGNGLDFRYKVDTANGRTDASRIILDRVEIGTVRVRNVEAMVLRDKALSGTLVGMSFLSKLRSYQVQDGGLTLVQ